MKINLLIRFNGKVLECNIAPDPTNIIWANLNTPLTEKIIRRTFSLLITIALLLIS